ncbi:MAG: hypothetical protein H6Q90_159 [Deltaproteobacteria bacterium]|nr:hypothetical protein [Deltaproteobacteria bacterium]
MTSRAELRRRPSGVHFTATRIAAELATISRDGIEVSFEDGRIRARIALDRDDAFSFPVEVGEEGDHVVARVVPPHDAIVNWSFLELGRALACDVLIDDALVIHGDDAAARRVVLGSAISDIQDFERRVLEQRASVPSLDALRAAAVATVGPVKSTPVRALIEALAAKGELVLVEGHEASLGAFEELADKPAELYEALLDSPAVDEIFLDEDQFTKRWRKLCG